MSAALEFTLGLQVSKFLEGIGLSSAKLLSLTAITEGVGKVMENVWKQIERGAALNDLSKRTGEAVSTLFQLQKAFTAAGVNSEGLGLTLFQMQKALGGISETGESTADAFHHLGLNLKDLQKLDSGAAFQQILAGLSKADNNTAAGLAAKIFGRGAAADAVQLSRSLGEFNEAFVKSANQAAIFSRVSELFDTIEKTATRVRNIFQPLWLGIAQYSAPAILNALQKIEQIDLSKFGQRIGSIIGLLAESFGNGKFSTILSLALQVGFDNAQIYAQNLAASLGAALAVVVPVALKGAFSTAISSAGGILGSVVAAEQLFLEKRKLSVMEQNKADSNKWWYVGQWGEKDDQKLSNQRQTVSVAQETLTGTYSLTGGQTAAAIAKTVKEMAEVLPKAMAEFKNNFNPETIAKSPLADKLEKEIADFKSRVDKLFPITGAGDKPGNADGSQDGQSPYHREYSQFEKMGFIMGGATTTIDYNRRTAEATEASKEYLATMSDRISRDAHDLTR